MKIKFLILIVLIAACRLLITGSCYAQFTFVHISDLHIADGLSAGDYDLNGAEFHQVQTAINNLNPKPAFVVVSGDISHAGNGWPSSMYEALTQYLYPAPLYYPAPGAYFIDSVMTIPIYFVAGNHDYRTGNVPPLSTSALTAYANYIAPDTDYYITYNNAVILFLRSGYDDSRPIWEDSNLMNPEGSGLTDSQCNWIRNILSDNSDKIKIIVMHHPPVDAIGTNCDGTPFTAVAILDTADGSIRNNRTAFLNICDSNHVDIVLAGHEHQNVVAIRNGNVVDENYTAGGTRYIQTTTALEGCYRVITVLESTVGNPMLLSARSTPYMECYYNSENKTLIISCKNLNNLSNNEIALYNTIGQLMFIKKTSVFNETKITINAGNLQEGCYFLTLQNGNNNRITKKIMIY